LVEDRKYPNGDTEYGYEKIATKIWIDERGKVWEEYNLDC